MIQKKWDVCIFYVLFVEHAKKKKKQGKKAGVQCLVPLLRNRLFVTLFTKRHKYRFKGKKRNNIN